MCVTRVGKVVRVLDGRASVEFFDGRALDAVDVSVVNAKRGEVVEVFGNMALSVLSPSEARGRKAAWSEIRRAARIAAEARPR